MSTNQDKIFYKSEGDKFFERNPKKINKGIFKAITFLDPKPSSNIFEIGCGSGTTLNKINKKFKSKVFGLDASKQAINYARKKYNLKNLFHTTFASFETKKKFDIVISGGFLYVTPNHLLKKTIKKLFKLTKKNGYLVIWDYDTPYNYVNNWKYDKNIYSFKRNLLNEVNKVKQNFYLLSKQLHLKDGKKINFYNNRIKIDNIFTVMIIMKID